MLSRLFQVTCPKWASSRIKEGTVFRAQNDHQPPLRTPFSWAFQVCNCDVKQSDQNQTLSDPGLKGPESGKRLFLEYTYTPFPPKHSVESPLIHFPVILEFFLTGGTGATMVPGGLLAEITMLVFIFLLFVHHPQNHSNRSRAGWSR